MTDCIASDIARYVGLGVKASGGPGDAATGQWLEDELAAVGFSVERQTFSAPFFETRASVLETGGASATVIPQAIVRTTPEDGLTGRLVRIRPGETTGDLRGAIALIDLPHQRWSTALARPVRDSVGAASDAGAVAAVLITNGPSGKALALNADGRAPMFDCPVAVLAPDEAAPFRMAASRGEPGVIRLTGEQGVRPAFNLIGRMDRARERTVVISTPRSGWFVCAGERGGGVAVWLDLARWAASALDRFNLVFVCTSGHEYENLGAEHLLEADIPPPSDTAAWVHLGANVAARDWHELTGALLPLSTPDPQRYLVATPSLLEAARRQFEGQPGLEAAYSSDSLSAGELTNILAAGYFNAVGIFGAHRFHHAREDDERCVDARAAGEVARSLRRLLEQL